MHTALYSFPPYLKRVEGSWLHHWLPRPCWVPVFLRAWFLASTLWLM